MSLNDEQKEKIIREAAMECGLDAHMALVEQKSDLSTYAEKMMGNMSNWKNPHKNSYLYLDSVDACFHIAREKACVTFTARWYAGAKDLSAEKMEKAIITINKMLETMQIKINEVTV